MRVNTVKCAPRHGWWCSRAAGSASLRGLQQLCRPVHGRALLHPLPLAWLRLTAILPSISSESDLSHQNPMVLPGSTDKPQYKHN